MFRGTYEHAVDAKGRTALPAKFREVLQGKYGDGALVLAPSPDGAPCLRAYPLQEWVAMEEKLAARGDFDRRIVTLRRFLVGTSHEVDTDKLGRLLVPQPMRERFGLKKDISFVGTTKYFEIWDAETFRNYTQQQMSEGDLLLDIEDLSI